MNTLNSAIYVGAVGHRRFSPASHAFKYNVFMMYLDLDEIDLVLSRSFFWSKKRGSLARFKRSDYFGNKDEDLKLAVTQRVEKELGIHVDGKVCMLTNMRYFGYAINPLTIYYCFDQSNNVIALLLEVTNTPWGQRQQYVLGCPPDEELYKTTFGKTMHVSPFHPMDMRYSWQSNTPGDKIQVNMENWLGDKCLFDANLSLQRNEVSTRYLFNILLSFPFMTVKVVTSIYWQALKLWFKKVPYHPNPQKTKH